MRPPRLDPTSLRQQIVLLTAGATAVAVVLLTVVLQLVLGHLAGNDVDRVVRDRASSVVASVRVKGGKLTVPPSQLSAGVAVYASGGTLVKGAVPANLADVYSRLRLTERDRTVSGPDDSRIEARPFRRLGTTGVVIVSEAFGPYEEAERLALVVSIVTGLLTVVAAAAVAAWATRRALRPVEEMARAAADWSESDLGRRFAGRPGTAASVRTGELGQLAVTLDGLLDRVSAAIRSEQRLTAELAHELRTPLTSIRGEAELAMMRDELPDGTRQALLDIVSATRRMSETISTLLDLARNEATVVAASQSSLGEIVQEVGAETERDLVLAGVALEIDVADVRVAVPRALAVRALAPVVENAVRFAEGRVVIRSARDGGYVDVSVEDDGPGIQPGLAESVFTPGVTSGRSAGLGLAISRRIARASGGDVTLADDSRPGANRLVVRLPVLPVTAPTRP